MRNDFHYSKRGSVLSLRSVNQFHKTPFRKKIGNCIAPLFVFVRKVGWLAIEGKQFFEMHDEISTLFMQNMTRLIENLILLTGNADACQSFADLEKVFWAFQPHVNQIMDRSIHFVPPFSKNIAISLS